MRLISIETTPNPNSMKLNFDESIEKAVTYSVADIGVCPEHVKKILSIAGVKSAFVCADFVTLNRDPRADWRPIIEAVTRALPNDLDGSSAQSDEVAGDNSAASVSKQRLAAEKSGRTTVLVQTFRGIPIQVKVIDGQAEKRLALSQRFSDAAQKVQTESGADYLKERYWADWGARYGSIEEVAADVAEEIEGTLDAAAVQLLVDTALGAAANAALEQSREQILSDLSSSDWHVRLRAVQSLPSAEENIPALVEALHDENHQVRRCVAAALGGTGELAAVEPLCDALLNDTSIAVRRTAGDALSDLGFVDAQPAMCKALSDPNKLVRWRAARFLAEVGTDFALIFLRRAEGDEAFEVQLEVAAALERITSAKEGSLPMWKRLLKGAGAN